MKDVVFPREVSYVPLKFHIVGDSQGKGRIEEEKLLDALCQLNENYADQGIQFYIKDGFNYVNNNTINTKPSSTQGINLIREVRRLNALNVFYTDQTVDNEPIAAYYQGGTSLDWIIVRNIYAQDVRVLTHEIGHYFSLPHPFHGWDKEPWDPAIHGNPVGTLAPDGRTVNEYADGSNCNPDIAQDQNNVGDGICDTPADYNFGGNDCSYKLNALDPQSKPVQPQVNNYMNYFFGCSGYIFTVEQKEEIQRSLQSGDRDYLRSNYQPNIAEIKDPVYLISPGDQEQLNRDKQALLKWEPVAGADFYLVEVDRSPSFDYAPISEITNIDSMLIQDLEPERNYFWRVRPFNEYYTCANATPARRFKTAKTVSVQELPFVRFMSIFPTVLKSSDALHIELDSEIGFNSEINLIDVSGRIMQRWIDQYFIPGSNRKQLQLNALPAGFYFIRLQTDQGTVVQKIIVGG
ncbi:MAG: zinc-dependent metalloprotease [Saprospiraceae bacterium]|nr:zinc-dependent metalloprotease [Saprospiraceae bacterium]